MSWLVPAAGPARDRLAGIIARLAAEHAAPVFAPHVTMAGVVESPAEAAARVLGRLVAGVPPFEVTLTGVGHEPEFYRSLYLRAEPHAVLTAMHEAGERAWALSGAPYRPHLSLLYARDLPEERKPAIADGLGLALPLTIRIDAAALAAALSTVLGDAALADRLRAAGYQVCARFTWPRCAAEHQRIYADLKWR